MSAFVVFTLIFTFCLLIYYAVMIALDLRTQGKKPSSHHEEFDVSGMQGEEEPKVISEVLAEPEEKIPEEAGLKPEPQPEQDPALVVQPVPVVHKTPSPAEQKVEQVREQLDPVKVQGSAELPVEDFAEQVLLLANQRGPKFGIHPKN